MSDTEQDVAQAVVSTALPCCFSPVVTDVNVSSEEASHVCISSDNGSSNVSYSHDLTTDQTFNTIHASAYEDISDNSLRPDISPEGTVENVKVNESEIKKPALFDANSQNVSERSGQPLSTDTKNAIGENATQVKEIPSSKNLTSPVSGVSDSQTAFCSALNVKQTSVVSTPGSDVKLLFVDSSNEQNVNKIQSQYQLKDSLSNEGIETKDSLYNEDYFSESTDGTLQNSEESSEPEESLVVTKQDYSNVIVTKCGKMGNKQAQTSKVRSDDDTPDDGRTKCCEIPKKKIKEKSGRSNRASRSDDLNFDSNEVYPFEGRSRSEQEINEPVELEPFEIVETDDIKFVPGAGTSDVIKSVSEPRFTTIAEEPPLSEDVQDPASSLSAEETKLKVPFYVDKGNRLIEPGTATAHSTFEFKQVKPKTKFSALTSDQLQHNYENVDRIDESHTESKESGRKTSSSSSKSSSSSSSKDVSRKNSKDAIPKPSRKGKSKTSDAVGESSVVRREDEKKKTKIEKSQNTQSVRDSEIDRKIDSVLMLTQTMFSQTKVTENQEKKQDKDQSQAVVLNQYENVNVCAKLEPTGIVITHKDTQPVLTKKENTKNDRVETKCVGNNCIEPKETVEVKTKRQNIPRLSKDIVEISDSGTLIIKSLADLPSAEPSEQAGDEKSDEHSRSESLSEDDNNDNTDVKVPYETIDRLSTEIKKENIESPSITEEKELTIEKEHVPPPSPLVLGALEEEAEEEFEDADDDIDFREEDRRKSEILEFTENVCKRLSHLLEVMPDEDDDEVRNETINSPEQERKMYEDHIYETIDGSTKIAEYKECSNSCDLINEKEVKNNELGSKSTEDQILILSTRSESSSTLKRTSGDSEIYNQQEMQRSSLSDDELPDYFDPREIPPPKRDSEILCDVLESYTDDIVQIDDLPSQEVSEILKSNKLNFEGLQCDKTALDNKGKDFSLPIQSFETDLINDTPAPSITEDLRDITPTAEAHPKLTALPELAKAEEESLVQFETSGRQSATCTESDLDISEHRDDLSTDSMLADDEAEETMEILFTKTYTEPVEGAEVFLSCTVVNSAYKDEQKKSETWLSDEALEYLEANASEVMSTAFLKAKKEMKDIQVCLQSLRQQMEHFHSDCDDISLPEIPVDSLSPDYFGVPMRKAVTD
ncbi:FK506-binding protein 5-like [Mercenaria mercenaria]|uniref:FK506-binding protein 5-like n=1 Tax=Mercenaria mercenaria TaxID=6596 RepID=UPI00234E62FE|nr:FK506-binding protein 5-like [Mercenaria mercenaria]XP_045208125.2 FK506-binding protein 5-like [Mercenaria mercenaria]